MPQVKAPTTQLLRRSPNKRAKRGVENVCVQSRFMQDAAKKPAAEEPPLKDLLSRLRVEGGGGMVEISGFL